MANSTFDVEYDDASVWNAKPIGSPVVLLSTLRKNKMATVTITGTATDSAGVSGNFSVVVTLDSFSLTAIVVPSIAPAGTTRNLTVTPIGGIAPFTFTTPVGAGL